MIHGVRLHGGRGIALHSNQCNMAVQQLATPSTSHDLSLLLLLFCWLMCLQVFGSWCPVAAAYGFFLAGAVLQRAVMLPVARGVFHQEAAEGGFRYSHVRLRTAAPEIAIYR